MQKCGSGMRRLRLHVRVAPMLVLIGLLYWALIILTNDACTYYSVLVALSTYYVLDHLFTCDPTQFFGVLSTSGIVGGAPESRT